MQRTTRTPDGRTLAVEEAGDPDGHPVLVHEGTPNSRHLYPLAVIDAASRGLRLISYDRPGYGGSSRSAISIPVLLMHGRQDQFVPFGHGEARRAHPRRRGPAARS